MNTNYSKQFLDKEDIKAVVKCLRSEYLTQGPLIQEFEKKIAKYVNSKYAVAVSSCTAGLHISLKALGFLKGDEIITSVISFVSTANISYFMDGKTKFVDIDNQSLGMNYEQIRRNITKKTKAIIPVHMSGSAYNMDKIRKISKKFKIPVIEDCAHAFGAKYSDGSMIGSCKFSDISVFSFHPVKSMTTGEGGVITTNSKSLYLKLLRLRSHGINKSNDKFINKKNAYTNGKLNRWYYEMRELGYHYRITDIQCALGLSQLKKINKFIKDRKKIAKIYDKSFHNLNYVKLVHSEMRNFSSNHLYILRINFKFLKITREQLFSYLRKKEIICQIHYIPIVMHPFYESKGFNIIDFPNAKKYYDECISIPCFYKLSAIKQEEVINLIKKFILKNYQENFLVFGGTGLLGGNILKNINKKSEIYSYVNNRKSILSHVRNTKLNINKKELKRFLINKNITTIINSAGLVSIEKCQSNKKLAYQSNANLVSIIIDAIKDTDIKLVHISTDHIFNKGYGKIYESEKFFSKNFYAETKIEAEKIIQNSKAKYLIIRSNFFGKGTYYRKSFSDYILTNLKNNNKLFLWKNIFFSPVNIQTLSKAIIKLINFNQNGVFNISSNQNISKYKFGRLIAQRFKLNENLIIPREFIYKNEAIKRPLNMSLSNRKFLHLFPNMKKELSIKKQIGLI